MSSIKISSHLIDELSYKYICDMAKISMLTGKQNITLSELDQNIKALGIESNSGCSWADSRTLIKNAYEYYGQKSKHKLARNIKQIYTDDNGNPVI